jgi:N-acetylglutamate synthase-like GNAT family acetyltransferase
MHEIRRATRADVPRLADVLAAAFADDPLWNWLLPDAVRAHRVPKVFEVLLRSRLRIGDDVLTTTQLAGAALWASPGNWDTTGVEQLRLGPPMLWLHRGSLRRAQTIFAIAHRAHPKHEPHWFLSVLGVDPTAQGTGVGSALLAPVLERCDEQGLPAYLETTKPENVAFYARHGFTVRDETDVPDGGPHLWFCWRAPRT